LVIQKPLDVDYTFTITRESQGVSVNAVLPVKAEWKILIGASEDELVEGRERSSWSGNDTGCGSLSINVWWAKCFKLIVKDLEIEDAGCV
jgi:hypothetical protein